MVNKRRNVISNWFMPLLLLGTLVGSMIYGLPKNGEAEFALGRVAELKPIAGQASGRLVTVALGDEYRIFRTESRILQTVMGQEICVKKSKTMFGDRDRYSLALMEFCRHIPRQSALAPTGDRAYL